MPSSLKIIWKVFNLRLSMANTETPMPKIGLSILNDTVKPLWSLKPDRIESFTLAYWWLMMHPTGMKNLAKLLKIWSTAKTFSLSSFQVKFHQFFMNTNDAKDTFDQIRNLQQKCSVNKYVTLFTRYHSHLPDFTDKDDSVFQWISIIRNPILFIC